MEVLIKSLTLDVDYDITPGQKEAYPFTPADPDVIEVTGITWTDRRMEGHDVLELFHDLGMMEEIETAVCQNLD